jgi:ATP adenylyltransferase/5',5'''-P-1,P-4-tetraphosphate phosphorylase II
MIIYKLNEAAKELWGRQMKDWPMAASFYQSLEMVQVNKFQIDELHFTAQFNPARRASTNAKVDQKSIEARPCFLCKKNLPPEQEGVDAGDFTLLVNPFPIFPMHFTIPLKQHSKQQILPWYRHFLQFAYALDEFVLFYNGPACGASAPDHLHFQAATHGLMPLLNDYKLWGKGRATCVETNDNATLYRLNDFLRTVYVIESEDVESSYAFFSSMYQSWQTEFDVEPLMNVIARYEDNRWTVFVLPRKAFRPTQYFAEDESRVMISPAAVEMAGILITPVEEDFPKITPELVRDIYGQISL